MYIYVITMIAAALTIYFSLDEYKKGLKEGSTLMDCLWGELYGSINIAEINDAAITHDHAEYLRNKYLR